MAVVDLQEHLVKINFHNWMIDKGYQPERRLEEPAHDVAKVVARLENEKVEGAINSYALIPEEFVSNVIPHASHFAQEGALVLYIRRDKPQPRA